MNTAVTGIHFDKCDHMILSVVEKVLAGEKSFEHLDGLLHRHLHHHGIKELTGPKEVRVACAAVRFFKFLESGGAEDRIEALRSLREEVLCLAGGHLPKNTARVLLRIMKELAETRGDTAKKLELAHAFRAAASGRPRAVRRLLREYDLLEMPEEWNQVTFDCRVRDSGELESPSGLVVDSWIRGIRFLTVLYRDGADLGTAVELLEASGIMGIRVRIGIEFPARFHGRRIRIAWVPKGISEGPEYASFLAHPRVAAFLNENRREFIPAIPKTFHRGHRPTAPASCDAGILQNPANCPEPAALSPGGLMERLRQLHCDCDIVLNLGRLKVEDVLELLFDGKGAVSHLETFDPGDDTGGETNVLDEIRELQRTLNGGNIIQFNQIVRRSIERMKAAPGDRSSERVSKFGEVLRNSAALRDWYRQKPLKAGIGGDLRGSLCCVCGGGAAVSQTLPRRARKEVRRLRGSLRVEASVGIVAVRQATGGNRTGWFMKMVDRLLRFFSESPASGRRVKREWEIESASTGIVPKGELIALCGTRERGRDGARLPDSLARGIRGLAVRCRRLDGNLKNALKASAGFVSSVLTFMHTQDGWFLACLGAHIWFGLTGLRSILQSACGGGWTHRTQRMRWKASVNWDRVSDSILFTGLSVPILEYFVKTLLLDRMFGITMSTDPWTLYAVLSVANGFCTAGCNILRGLPGTASTGGLILSVINPPVCMALGAAVGAVPGIGGAASSVVILQQWATIVVKASSDLAAGVIGGIADGFANLQARTRDYEDKTRRVFRVFERAEALVPEADGQRMLEAPDEFLRKGNAKGGDLAGIAVVNALDLFYFWMCQPRARHVFRSLLRRMPEQEREVLKASLNVLRHRSEVVEVIAGGMAGKNRLMPLLFYLEHHEEYLRALDGLMNAERKKGFPIGKPAVSRPSPRLLDAGEGWQCLSK
ncbi:MAG: hypothetical protein ABFD98_13480 [Syntrophobacteraceae bacterium]|nr:hypothetical protein [Desulfobacteraceae bacterium]